MRIRRPIGERKKTCSKCNQELEAHRVDKYRYCLKCHSEYAASKYVSKERQKYGVKDDCSKCGQPLGSRKGVHRYCLSCFNEYSRVKRKRHSELTDEQRKKVNARSYVNVYIRRGAIKKQPCEKCSAEKAEMHHDDYDKPLEVKWLCRKCHLEYHKIKKQ